MKKKEPAGEGRNRKRKILPLAAVVLTAALVMTAAQMPGVTAKAATPNLDADCSLEILPSSDKQIVEDLVGSGGAENEVAIELYKVADAVAVPGYDTYGYEVLADYANGFGDALSQTNLETITAAEWERLAKTASETILAEGSQITPAATGMANEKINGLEPGLYLMVAKDAIPETGSKMDPANEKESVVTEPAVKPDGLTVSSGETVDPGITDPAAGGDIEQPGSGETTDPQEPEGKTTQVMTEKYTYTFAPQLVSLPGRPLAEDGIGGNTANRTSWDYDVTATLKPERRQRFGDLKITKTLQNYETEAPGDAEGAETFDKTVTFVFDITAVEDGTVIYSNEVGLTFTGAETQEYTLADQIPVGADIYVKEVYSGATYKVNGSDTLGGTLTSADQLLTAEFVNSYDRQHRGGHGIVNSFAYDENNGWQWTSDPNQSQSPTE